MGRVLLPWGESYFLGRVLQSYSPGEALFLGEGPRPGRILLPTS